MRAKINRLANKGIRILGSDRSFYAILALLALQALWYALSFQPSINDEGQHLGNILFYTHHLSPFVSHQDKVWDILGDITRNGSYMYYYLMSWPMRILSFITDSYPLQVFILRLINIAFVVGGVYFFRKALQKLGGLPSSVVNFILLVCVLTPTVVLLAGAVNYDNLVFLGFAYSLLLAITVLNAKKPKITDIAQLLIVGLLITIIKWSSIALVIPVFAFVIWHLYKQLKLSIFTVLWHDLRKLPTVQFVLILTGLIIATILFIERPLVNFVQYGKPSPACQQVLSPQRCENFPNYHIYKQVLANKSPTFKPANPIEYVTNYWAPKMIVTASNQLERTSTQLPIVVALFSLFVIVGSLAVLLCFRELVTSKFNVFLLSIVAVYFGLLLMSEYGVYTKYGIIGAVRARYIIPLLPAIGYLMAVSVMLMFGKYRKSLLVGAIITVVLLTQGGSIATYALTTPPSLEWQNKNVLNMNKDLKNILSPLVKE